MHFDLTDDQKLLQGQIGGLLADRLGDKALMRLYDKPDTFDPDLWSDLMGMGLGSILIDEDKGGLGMGLLTLAVVAESLGRAAAPAPVIANALAAWLLAEAGGQEEHVVRLTSGEAIAGFALAARGGWGADSWTLDGDHLNGGVGSVEWGSRATLFLVGLAGGRIGLVERDAPGLTVDATETVDRTRPVASLEFDGAAVEVLSLDRNTIDRLLDAMATLFAADACGAASKALDLALDYAKVRTQFGRPIGAFQGLKYQLVNLAIEVEPCRPLVWYAAHAWDAIPAQAPRAAAIAKAHVTDVAVRTGRMAVEAHGGIGYTWEYPLHVWLKRAMHDRTVLGTPAIHRDRAAALAGW